METKKYFCVECRKEVNVTIETGKVTTTIKGIDYTYDRKDACCTECGEYVYVEDIHDSNLREFNKAYEKIGCSKCDLA